MYMLRYFGTYAVKERDKGERFKMRALNGGQLLKASEKQLLINGSGAFFCTVLSYACNLILVPEHTTTGSTALLGATGL